MGESSKVLPGWTGLPSGLLAAALAQTLGLSLKAVGGRRQMAVVALFLQALLPGLHLLRKPIGLLLQSLDQALLLIDHGLLHVDGLLLHTCSFP